MGQPYPLQCATTGELEKCCDAAVEDWVVAEYRKPKALTFARDFKSCSLSSKLCILSKSLVSKSCTVLFM
ncbi:hypothetical protein KC330_g93 [Hortaea werneckii]|nr:hypothetical protein KC330_g93 [Hortaea werneckii]